MVFAIAFAGVALITPSESVDATEEPTYVAEIGSTKYTTLEDAVAAVKTGETIKLLDNVEISKTLTFTTEGEYTLDIGSYNVTQTNTGYMITVGGSNPPSYPFDTINDGVQLTILGDGLITSQSTTFRSYGKIVFGADGVGPTVEMKNEKDTHSIFKVEEGSYLTINGGKFTVGGSVERVMQSFGTTIINNGTFNGNIELWKYTDYTSTVTIGPKVVINGQCSSYLYDASTSFTDADGFTGLDVKIGTTWYTTLSQAVEAVQDGETITLLGDVEIGNIIKDSNVKFTIEGTDAETLKKITFTNNANNVIGSVTLKNLELIPYEEVGFLMISGAGEAIQDYSLINVRSDYNLHVYNGVQTISFEDCKFKRLVQFQIGSEEAIFSIDSTQIGELNICKSTETTIDLENGQIRIDSESTFGRISTVNGDVLIQNSEINVDSFGAFSWTENEEIKTGTGKIIFGADVTVSPVNKKIVTIEENLVVEIGEGVTFANDLNLDGKLSMKKDSVFKGTIKNETKGIENSITSSKGIKAGDKGLNFSKGSIIMNGEALVADETGTITITGNATLDDDTEIQNLVIAENATLTIPNEKSLTITGDSVNDGKLINNGEVNNSGTFTNNNTIETTDGDFNNSGKVVQSSTATTDGEISGNQPVSDISESDDSLGLKNYLENDFTVTKKAFLAGDLTVKEGVTLTIASTGSLDLNGHKLILEGNLVVATGGTISALNDGTETANVIQIMKTGTISSTGVIGKGTHTVMVTIGDTDSYEGVGSVSMMNVNGVSFGTKKVIDGDVTYVLTVSGTVVKDGVGDAKIEIEDAIIASDMIIGSDIKFIGDAIVAKNVVLTINGDATGTVFIEPGATVDISGKTTDGFTVGAYSAIISATGSLDEDDIVAITVTKTYGILIYADSEVYMDNGIQYTNYQIHISGTPVSTETTGTSSDIQFEDSVNGGQKVVIDREFTITSDYDGKTAETVYAMPIYVDGKVTFPYSDTAKFTEFDGTLYTIETEVNGAKVKTSYITPFDDAFSIIDSTYLKTITVKGVIELDGIYNIAAKQKVDINSATVTISENGSVTVASEGKIDGQIDTVEGILTVLYGASAKAPVNYDVKTVFDNGDVSYSGIAIAIKNAQAGQTVTIVKDASVTDSLTVPEGVKVVINEDASLTVAKNLNVKGEIVNNNIISVGKDITVSGKIDSSAGTLTVVNGDSKINSTGDIILTRTNFMTLLNNINGAAYLNDDRFVVVTTVVKAVTASGEKDIPSDVLVIGTVTENDAIVSNDVNILIVGNSIVNLSNVTINDAQFSVGENVTFTGSVTAKTGDEDSTVDSIISMVKASNFMVENYKNMGANGVTTWYLCIETNDSSNNYLFGEFTVKAGTVTIDYDLDVNSSDVSAGKLTVNSGATLVIEETATLTSIKGVSVSGTLVVDGTFNTTAATVSGEMIVSKTGTVNVTGLTLKGTAIVESDEDDSGVINVVKVLTLGEAMKSLGAGASISGNIDITGNNYILAYAGSDLSAAVINNGNAVSTELIINGVSYATVYGAENNSKALFGTVGVFDSSISLTGLVMTDSATYNKWTTDEAGTKALSPTANVIGGASKVYFSAEPASVPGKISTGTGLALYIDGLSIDNYVMNDKYWLDIGVHTVTYSVLTGYDGSNAKITFNGQTVGSDGKITVTADMTEFILAINGATPAVTPTPEPTPTPTPSEKDDSMGLTEYLLIVLVILAAILVVVVAVRMMRS